MKLILFAASIPAAFARGGFKTAENRMVSGDGGRTWLAQKAGKRVGKKSEKKKPPAATGGWVTEHNRELCVA